MMTTAAADATLSPLDAEAIMLVRLAAIIAVGSEEQIRTQCTLAAAHVRPLWVEELILQSYLFAGFPRTLNAAREWRRASGRAAPPNDPDAEQCADTWTARGEVTCAIVYGASYERLRHNIRALHPALDRWMIVEGYGKVLSRDGLPLVLRELCIVAVCAASRQDRQLHAHLRGALNAGATPHQVTAALGCIDDLLGDADRMRYRTLATRVITS